MADKIPYEEFLEIHIGRGDGGTWLGHFIFDSLTGSGSNGGREVVDDVAKKGHDAGHLLVSLKVFDHEVSIEPFIKHVEEQIESMIQERAQALLRERFDSMATAIYDAQQQMEKAFREAFPSEDE